MINYFVESIKNMKLTDWVLFFMMLPLAYMLMRNYWEDSRRGYMVPYAIFVVIAGVLDVLKIIPISQSRGAFGWVCIAAGGVALLTVYLWHRTERVKKE